MSRRRTAVAALERLQQRCAVESELEELQQLVTESLTLVESSSSTARGILEGITAMGLSCVALADEVGLRVVVAESLGDALCATAQLFAAEDEESSTQDRTIDRLKFNHRHATAKFLEPLGAAMDGLVLDISHSLARAEVEMHQDPEALEMLSLHHAPAESASTEAVRLYRALTAVCMWLLAIAVRGIGYSHFSADALWDFAGEDAYSAVLFAKGALCFEQFAEDTDASYVEDLPELRDAIMGALLGLCRHDIAFRDCVDPEANIDISIRNEQLALHRATVAAAAARQQLMPCLLAFPWRTGLMGDKRLPELVSFLRETVDSGSFPRWSAFLNSLGEDVDEWRREVRWFTELWSLMDLAPPKRGVLRDLAALARVAPPNEVACRALLQRCLSSASHDAVALASLVAVANYAGLQPGGDVLSAVLSHLEDAQRQQVAEKLRSMPHAEAWAELLEETPPAVLPAELERQDLRALLADVPAPFRCLLDGRLLVDPVRTPTGHGPCERSVLSKVLAQQGCCPFTGTQLTLSECQRDAELRKEIRSWLRNRATETKKECPVACPVAPFLDVFLGTFRR